MFFSWSELNRDYIILYCIGLDWLGSVGWVVWCEALLGFDRVSE